MTAGPLSSLRPLCDQTDLSTFLQRIGAESRGGHRYLIGGNSVFGDDREILAGRVSGVSVEISARPVREKEFSGLVVSRVAELRAGTRVGLVSRRAAELDTVIRHISLPLVAF